MGFEAHRIELGEFYKDKNYRKAGAWLAQADNLSGHNYVVAEEG